MSRAESLLLEVDTLKVELERLKAENAKLRASRKDDVDESMEEQEHHTQELYEQAVSDLTLKEEEIVTLRGELEVVSGKLEAISVERREAVEELERVKDRTELELHRALATERQKWEQRESRLIEQLEELQQRRDTTVQIRSTSETDERDGVIEPSVVGTHEEIFGGTSGHVNMELHQTPRRPFRTEASEGTLSTGGTQPQSTVSVTPQPSEVPLSLQAALLNQQMIQIPKFSGDSSCDYEGFEEWQEQFELVANACQWTEAAKLVNLATRLKGQAYSFYRSCTPDQRAKYSLLSDALNKRFTPVRLQAVQSSLFHERKQGINESVDTFAQELKRLFYKAYPNTLQGTSEAETMGKSVLASQFVAGLRHEIKIKLAGTDGTIDQLLTKARFEEAKIKELGIVKQHPRRVPFALRSKVEKMINQMLQQSVIEPSKSPWASPIVLVSKKDGSTRFCVDYRKLNARTKKDVYPLPRIDDTLDLLATNEFFSTLDLASGYWQIKMDEASKEKTAFTTHVGLFEFKVMPFGLCNAPATFQRLMENILHGIIGKACLVYLDDILVLGRTVEEHLQNLAAVWERLREAGLRLKPSKCKLLQREVEYLGFCVSAAGVATSPQKVTAVSTLYHVMSSHCVRS